jgi:uncharacterized Zn finger protein
MRAAVPPAETNAKAWLPTHNGAVIAATDTRHWSNPCKHVAAVFYLIGEEFDRDPFLLFVVRGRERDDVRDLFGPQTEAKAPRAAVRPSAKRLPKPRTRQAPAAVSPEAFWGDHATEPKTPSTRIETTSTDEPAVLKRAGKLPFWRAEVALADAIVPIYNEAAAYALNWLADRAQSAKE